MLRILTPTAVLALMLAGCDRPDATTADSAIVEGAAGVGAAVEDAAGGAIGVASANLPKTAPEFVQAAAIANLYEIQAADLALQKAQSPVTKQVAERMKTDHAQMNTDLQAAAKAVGGSLTIPTTLDARREEMIANLRGVSQQDFDERYLEQQEMAHQESLALMSGYADGGDFTELRELAAKAAVLIDQHLATVRQVENSLDNREAERASTP